MFTDVRSIGFSTLGQLNVGARETRQLTLDFGREKCRLLEYQGNFLVGFQA